jgi:hypothetical protein
VLGPADVEPPAPPAPELAPTPSGPIVVTSGDSESIMRIVVGAIVIASDVYWWVTDPSMQTLYVRIGLLAAGAWLVLSGVWKGIANARTRLHAAREVEAASGRKRDG